MTPVRLRLLAGAMALLSAMVVANLLLQAPTVDRPLHAQRAPAATVAEADAAPRAGAADRPGPAGVAGTATAAGKTVGALQRELNAKGYFAGPETGSINLATRAAILAWEFDHGWPLTGEPSQAVLSAVVFGATAEPPVSPVVASAGAKHLIRAVQRALAARGYGLARVDGQLTGETRRAIEAFEAAHGLTRRGRVSGEVVVRLKGLEGWLSASAQP